VTPQIPKAKVPAVPQANVKIPAANALKTKTPAAPKMTHMSATLAPGTANIQHHFTNGGSQSFNFHDPEVAAQHIRRTLKHEWQHPEKNEAAAVDESLNIPPAV